MAQLLYKDKLIFSAAEFTQDAQGWSVRISISWRLLHDLLKFDSQAQAEQFGLEIAKEWIDRHIPNDIEKN